MLTLQTKPLAFLFQAHHNTPIIYNLYVQMHFYAIASSVVRAPAAQAGSHGLNLWRLPWVDFLLFRCSVVL